MMSEFRAFSRTIFLVRFFHAYTFSRFLVRLSFLTKVGHLLINLWKLTPPIKFVQICTVTAVYATVCSMHLCDFSAGQRLSWGCRICFLFAVRKLFFQKKDLHDPHTSTLFCDAKPLSSCKIHIGVVSERLSNPQFAIFDPLLF